MLIDKAYKLGLLKVGVRVSCNGDCGGYNNSDVYTGIITHSDFDSFTVSRDDCCSGNGYKRGWVIFPKGNKGDIRFINQTATQYCAICGKEETFCYVNGNNICKKCVFEIPQCSSCGILIMPDSEIRTSKINEPLCYDCMIKLYATCRRCGKYEVKEHLLDGFCKVCAAKTSLCDECGKRFYNTDVFSTYDEDNSSHPSGKICVECRHKLYFSCRSCGRIVSNESKYEISMPSGTREPYICIHCVKADGLYKKCEKCNRYDYHAGMMKKKDILLCSMCVEAYKPKILSTISNREDVKKTILAMEKCKHRKVKSYNLFNPKDYGLEPIATAIGKVSNPIYLYGVKNIKGESIVCSRTLFDAISTSGVFKTDGDLLYIESPAGRESVRIGKSPRPNDLQLGFSLHLRKAYSTWVSDTITSINKLLDGENA